MRYVHLVKNLSNWWLHLACKFGLTRADPLIFRTRKGVSVAVPRRLLHEFKEIFLEECYVSRLGVPVPEKPTIIDIGANAGFFTLFAASRYPGATILAYEPIESNYKQLARNVLLNETHHIRCYQKAVYGKRGEISLRYDARDSYTTSATIFNAPDTRLHAVTVPCLTLPDILEEHHLSRCDLLKMDCEGAEYDILRLCPDHRLRRVSQMAIEVHGGKEPYQNIRSLAGFLSSRGFKTSTHGDLLWAWQMAPA